MATAELKGGRGKWRGVELCLSTAGCVPFENFFQRKKKLGSCVFLKGLFAMILK